MNMKNVLYPIVGLALAMSIASCTKEENEVIGDHFENQQRLNQQNTSNEIAPIIPNKLLDLSIAEEYIVMLKDNTFDIPSNLDYESQTELVKNKIGSLLDLNSLGSIEPKKVFSFSILGFSARLTDAQKTLLTSLDVVQSIEPNVPVQAFITGAAVESSAAGQTIGYGAQRVGYASGVGKTAYVLDTGVDTDHPDLNVNISLSKSFVSGVSSVEDGHGHGTHCAGIIAAKDNQIGIVGVAAGATIVAVKVLDDGGSGATSDIIAGVDYVVSIAKPGEVVNMSLGSLIPNSSMDAAVIAAANKGILFTLAAGNSTLPASTTSPARANGDNIYTISAMDQYDQYAYYSNYGNPPVDYCMPGSSVYSTYKNGGYSSLSGTSMAAPHMAGVLTIRGKNFNTDGTVFLDPDLNNDPIATL